MASDDDTVDLRAALSELQKEQRDARRSARTSRLPRFLDDGAAGSSPQTKTKVTPAKPLSMLAEEAKAMKEGGLGHIGKGKGNTITFDDWIRKLNRIMPFLGADLSYKAQIAAAEGVANMLRKFLLEGVDPKLSGMTIGLHKNRLGLSDPTRASRPIMDHDDRRVDGMALAALAPHVKVNAPPKMRTRGGKAKDGKPGFPGVFAKGYGPCTISFDSEKYDKIAYVLEHGRFWKPPDGIRKALMAKAIEGGFSPSEKSTTGYWEIPPRPFSHILTGAEAQRIVRKTAEAAMMGTLKQEMAARKEAYIDVMDKARADIEDFDQVMSSGDDVEDELIELLDRGRGPRKRR